MSSKLRIVNTVVSYLTLASTCAKSSAASVSSPQKPRCSCLRVELVRRPRQRLAQPDIYKDMGMEDGRGKRVGE